MPPQLLAHADAGQTHVPPKLPLYSKGQYSRAMLDEVGVWVSQVLTALVISQRHHHNNNITATHLR